jgi:YgiT-type zinc finger domain-containing protein
MMSNRDMQVETQVTYTLELNGKFFVIENVPARVDEETGEQFFSPSTVEHLQQIVMTGQAPDRFTEVPVYKYAT